MKFASIGVLLLAFATPAHAQEKGGMEQLNELVLIRENIEMLEKLGSRDVLLQSESKIAEQLSRAGKVLGAEGPITCERLFEVTGGSSPPPTAWQKITGFFTFVNIVMVIAAIMLTIAVVWLFSAYFVSLILAVPRNAWEVIAYAICLFMIWMGWKAKPGMQLLWVLPGCFGLIGALQLNYHNWWELKDVDGGNLGTPRAKTVERFNHFASLVLAIAWGAVAYAFESQFLGFMAAGAFVSFLGFACGMIPGLVWIGFEGDSDAVVVRATLAAFGMSALYTVLYATGQAPAFLNTFGIGMSSWGYFVFYLGMLIMSSKYWSWESDTSTDGGYTVNWRKYLAMQILTVCAGVAALYVGSVYGIGLLKGIGGTFFGLFLMEKWYDIRWVGVGWAWSLLGLSAMLYLFVIFAQQNPEYFLFVAE